MKTKYKKLFLWSSLGSVAAGAAVAMARRMHRRESAPVLNYRKIPPDCSAIRLWTEYYELEENGKPALAYDSYLLQPTSFRVWKILDLTSAIHTEERSEGEPIYHITVKRIHAELGSNKAIVVEQPEEKFYGVVRAVDPLGRRSIVNAISRGGILEIGKCYVGGASNGIESGENHRSRGKILNYRIEHTGA